MKWKFKIVRANTLGMFDLFKGVAMLAVVFKHTSSLFPGIMLDRILEYSEKDALFTFSYVHQISILGKLIFAILSSSVWALIPALLVIAGYGFRKMSIDKSLKLYTKELLKPYFFTMAAVTILNFCLHYAFFRWIPGALEETLKVFLGMAYGVSKNTVIGQLTLFANGAVWYLLAMFWALFVYNIIVTYVNEKYVSYVSIGISIIGWLLSYWKYTPFCISQGLVSVFYIHIGHYLKKKRKLITEYGFKEIILFIFGVIIPNIILLAFGMVNNMGDNVYSLGPISYIESGLWGVGIIFAFLKLNVFRGKISRIIRNIGRYSLYVMCVHTVEQIAVPWYLLADGINNKVVAFFVIFFVRLFLITIGCVCVIYTNRILKNVRKGDLVSK